MDRFGGAQNGHEAVKIAKEIIRELFPWEWEWAKEMELADENGWLVGRFPPPFANLWVCCLRAELLHHWVMPAWLLTPSAARALTMAAKWPSIWCKLLLNVAIGRLRPIG
jgi:hypothetical protein